MSTDRIVDQFKYADFSDPEAAWDAFRENYVLKTPEQRIIDLQAIDSFLELETSVTKEHASLLTRRRELADIHSRLRNAGR